MFRCGICGEEFNSSRELVGHDAGHIVRPVTEEPLVMVLNLPDGVTEGRYAAAEAFADGIKELRAAHPGKKFQYVPFTYKSGYLTAMLAIAEPEGRDIDV